MLIPETTEIFVATTPTDFRKSYHGLCGVVRDVLREAPESGALFVFRNKRGDQVKILFYDRNGYVIWMKQLGEGVFRFPVSNDNSCSRRLTMAELAVLLEAVGVSRSGRKNRKNSTFSYEDASQGSSL